MRSCYSTVLLLALGLSGIAASTIRGADTPFGSALDFTAVTYENGVDGWLITPGGAFYDKRSSELFVAATGNRRIIIYDSHLIPKFTMQHFVTERSTGNQILGEPKAVAVNSNGDILVLDNLADYLDVLDFRGTSLLKIFPNRLLKDTTLKIRADLMAIDDQDNVYLGIVGDVQTVLVLNRDYELKRKIIQKGTELENTNTPVALGVYDSLVIVTDLYATPAVKVFDTLGNYETGFGGHDVEQSDFSLPIAVAVSPDSTGHLYFLVADALRQVVKVLDEHGKLQANIGGFGPQIGALQYPSGLTSAGNRTFFVVERVGARVQKFEIR